MALNMIWTLGILHLPRLSWEAAVTTARYPNMSNDVACEECGALRGIIPGEG